MKRKHSEYGFDSDSIRSRNSNSERSLYVADEFDDDDFDFSPSIRRKVKVDARLYEDKDGDEEFEGFVNFMAYLFIIPLALGIIFKVV